MSRTIRRKKVKVPKYITHTVLGWNKDFWFYDNTWIPRSEIEQAQRVAKFYSDAGHSTYYHCSTKGRKWFRRDEQKKYRRDANRELLEFSKNEEHEVMILANPKLPYWD